jgi:hypothetical protein
VAIVTILFSLCTQYVEARPALAQEELRAQVAATYHGEIGVREDIGPNDGIRIREYRTVSKFKYPVSWCAIFTMWTYTQNGVPFHQANEWVPSWSRPQYVVYARGRPNNKTPRQADVFTLYYQHLKREGHIGFVDQWPRDSEYIITVEGNTNQAGSREGDGVHRKRRLKASIYKVMDYISPLYG